MSRNNPKKEENGIESRWLSAKPLSKTVIVSLKPDSKHLSFHEQIIKNQPYNNNRIISKSTYDRTRAKYLCSFNRMFQKEKSRKFLQLFDQKFSFYLIHSFFQIIHCNFVERDPRKSCNGRHVVRDNLDAVSWNIVQL